MVPHSIRLVPPKCSVRWSGYKAGGAAAAVLLNSRRDDERCHKRPHCMLKFDASR
jgi:hypothetical protein